MEEEEVEEEVEGLLKTNAVIGEDPERERARRWRGRRGKRRRRRDGGWL